MTVKRAGRCARWALVLILFSAPGCVHGSPGWTEIDEHELRRGAQRGDARDAVTLAEVLLDGRLPEGRLAEAERLLAKHGTSAEERALLAEVLWGQGKNVEALDAWTSLLAEPSIPDWLRRFLAIRAWTLRDMVPLTSNHGDDLTLALRSEAAHRSTTLVRLALAVGRRLERAELVDLATAALGPAPVLRTSTAPVSGLVSLRLSQEAEAGSTVTTLTGVDGAFALPDAGPGTYVVELELPRMSGPRYLEVETGTSLALFVGGRLVTNHDQHLAWLPGVVRVPLTGDGADPVKLQVGTRAGGDTLNVRIVRGALSSQEPPRSTLGRQARLWLAMSEGDERLAAAAASDLMEARRGLAALALERWLELDGSRPAEVTEGQRFQVLQEARRALPDMEQASLRLAHLNLRGGSAQWTEAWLGELWRRPNRAVGLTLAARWLDLALAQEQDAPGRVLAASAHLLRLLPRSCEAAAIWVDAHWERLRTGALATPTTPSGCPQVGLALAGIELEAWRLAEARERLLALLPKLSPGARVAEGRALLARVDYGLGDEERSLEHVAAARDLTGSEELRDWARAVSSSGSGVSDVATSQPLPPASAWLPPDDGSSLGPEAVILRREHETLVRGDGSIMERFHEVVWLGEEPDDELWGQRPLPPGAETLVARTWLPSNDPSGWNPVSAEDLPETGSVSFPRLGPGVVTEVGWSLERPPPLESIHRAGLFLAPVWLGSADADVAFARWTLRLAPGWAMSWEGGPGVASPSSEGPGIWRWEVTDQVRHVQEPLDPRPDRRLAFVRVALTEREVLPLEALRDGVEEGGRWERRVSPGVRELAEGILQEIGGDAGDQLRALHAYVLDHIEPVDVHGAGMPVAAFTAARGRGDRAVLLAALCEAAGLQCGLVHARPRWRGAISPDDVPPDPEDWSEPFVVARIDGQLVWLDVSSSYVPFDLIPAALQGVPILERRPFKQVTSTPRRPMGQRRIVLDVVIQDDGSWVARAVESLDGLVAAGWRHLLVPADPARRERALRGMLGRVFPEGAVQDVELGQLNQRGGALTLTWSASGRLQSARGEGSLSVGLSPEDLTRATVFVSQRTTPLWVDRLTSLDLTLNISLQGAWTPGSLPDEARASALGMTYERTTRAGSKGLTIRKVVQLEPLVVPSEDYDAWRSYVESVDRGDRIRLQFLRPADDS